LDAWVSEEDAEPFAHEAGADVRVAVAVRAERRGGVVHVQAAQALEADPPVDLAERRVEKGRVGDVDPRDPEVAGVEAEAQAGVVAEAVDQDGELVHGAADRPAGSGRVLE